MLGHGGLRRLAVARLDGRQDLLMTAVGVWVKRGENTAHRQEHGGAGIADRLDQQRIARGLGDPVVKLGVGGEEPGYGRPALVLDLAVGGSLRIASFAGVGVLSELAERLSHLSAAAALA